MWCTVPRGTHTISSLPASITVPPVSSHFSRPAMMTHHSSKSLCQCGRLPVPGGLAINVTRLRSSAISRTDQGGGPDLATTSAMRMCRLFGQVGFITRGGIGPLTTSVMLSLVAGSVGAVIAQYFHTAAKAYHAVRRIWAGYDRPVSNVRDAAAPPTPGGRRDTGTARRTGRAERSRHPGPRAWSAAGAARGDGAPAVE